MYFGWETALANRFVILMYNSRPRLIPWLTWWTLSIFVWQHWDGSTRAGDLFYSIWHLPRVTKMEVGWFADIIVKNKKAPLLSLFTSPDFSESADWALKIQVSERNELSFSNHDNIDTLHKFHGLHFVSSRICLGWSGHWKLFPRAYQWQDSWHFQSNHQHGNIQFSRALVWYCQCAQLLLVVVHKLEDFLIGLGSSPLWGRAATIRSVLAQVHIDVYTRYIGG